MENQNNEKILDDDIERNKDVAAFAWTLIFAPILLVFRKDSAFIQFHAKQATILFIVGILIYSIPAPYSRLNVFTALVAIMGFMHANQSNWWRAPILFDLVQKGVSPTKIVYGIKNFIFKFFDVIKRVFVSGAKVVSKKSSERKENIVLNSKINLLEEELLIEKYLQGEKISSLSDEEKKNIEQIKTLFINNKYSPQEEEFFIRFQVGESIVFLGNLDEKGGLLFFNKDPGKNNIDLSFASWSGIAVIFNQDFEDTLNKIKKFL